MNLKFGDFKQFEQFWKQKSFLVKSLQAKKLKIVSSLTDSHEKSAGTLFRIGAHSPNENEFQTFKPQVENRSAFVFSCDPQCALRFWRVQLQSGSSAWTVAHKPNGSFGKAVSVGSVHILDSNDNNERPFHSAPGARTQRPTRRPIPN